VAVAHKILVIINYLLVEGTFYDEQRYDHLQPQQEDRQRQRAIKALEQLGYHVTVERLRSSACLRSQPASWQAVTARWKSVTTSGGEVCLPIGSISWEPVRRRLLRTEADGDTVLVPYAAMVVPVISCQIRNRWASSWRYSGAEQR
jgi:hypothetical protein